LRADPQKIYISNIKWMVINTPDAGWRQRNCLFLRAKNAMDGAWLHDRENENWQSAATLGAPFY